MNLQELIDERDIYRVLGRFAEVLDNKDWAAMGEVYTDNVTYDYGFGEEAGLDTIVAMTRRHLEACAASQHLLGSIRVKVDGDHAISRSYVQARHRGLGDKSDRFFDTNGEYTDRWERRDIGWRIVRRDVRWFMHIGDPSVLGIEAKMLA